MFEVIKSILMAVVCIGLPLLLCFFVVFVETSRNIRYQRCLDCKRPIKFLQKYVAVQDRQKYSEYCSCGGFTVPPERPDGFPNKEI